jgi:3-keto-5-aminohexanoate cleavage enzyme
VTVEAIAATAERCRAVGAAALHLHVRDQAGAHGIAPELYRPALAAIERATGGRLAGQVTTEAVGRYGVAEQMAAVRALQPAAVSLALRELMPDDADLAAARAFVAWLVEARISPQYLLDTAEEVRRFAVLRAASVISQRRPLVIFVLGRCLGPGEVSDPRDLLAFLAEHDAGCPWMVCAFGRTEPACLALAASLGGHVRVGLENSLERSAGPSRTRRRPGLSFRPRPRADSRRSSRPGSS